MSNFCGLHVHSEHSFLDGYSNVDAIAKRAKSLGQPAVALTDHGEVNGHLAFQKACAAQDVKPIFGMEGYWVRDSETRKEVKNSHITLLAATNQGLVNLYAWTSLAYEDQYRFKKPLADIPLMRQYGEGIYASDGCMLTDFARAVEAGDEDAARQYVGTLLDIFGERFFMELHTWQIIDPQTDEHKSLNQLMTDTNQAKLRLATEMGIPLVVVNDAHYTEESDWDNHALVWDMNTGGRGDQAGKGQAAAHMMDDEELIYWMSKHGIAKSVTEEAIKNTFFIAENCNAEITTKLEMPRITPSDRDDLMMFLNHVERGFKRKVEEAGLDRETYYARMEEEVSLIAEKGFAGYFNIVADLTKAAKGGEYIRYVQPGSSHDPLLICPGRGSAGGSLVAYLMDITELDPIRYGLLFGRFMTPGRKGYPDIDIDVPQSKRPDLKQYLAARHGHDRVCGIGTRSRSGPKRTLLDLCKVYGVEYKDTNAMRLLIEEAYRELLDDPEEEDAEWSEVLERKGGDLADYAKRYPQVFDKMEEMVGICRNPGVHAAGLVISSQPLLGSLPTRVKNDTTATQWDMWELEELGAVKFDLLGIRHLDTLMVARKLIHERHGIWLDYERFGPEQYEDPAIWEPLHRGDTLGIFQLETAGGTKACKDHKPLNEEDVATLSAVNRPGVIDAGLYPVFMKRRAGEQQPEYDHPLLEPITAPTYGILVYQEQMLEAVQVLGGFTLDEADDLRKYIGKKQMDKLLEMEDKFTNGCRANGLDDKTITKVWQSISAAGRYGFNKSHAMGYGLVSTWEVWTKFYYPAEFFTALLQTDPENTNKYIRECRRRGWPILPPDINDSKGEFTLHDENTIRYGLESVRGVGSAASVEIAEHQPYESLPQYLSITTKGRNKNKKTVVDALIKIGAFDRFGLDRNELLNQHYDHRILSAVAPRKRSMLTDEDKAQLLMDKRAAKPEEYPLYNFDDSKTIYEMERELVGRFITIDPMAKYINMIDAVCIKHPDQYREFDTNDLFHIGGQITKLKPWKTKKKNEDMAFMTITWAEEDFEVLVFPDAYRAYRSLLQLDAPVACSVIKLDRNACHLSTLERLDYLYG